VHSIGNKGGPTDSCGSRTGDDIRWNMERFHSRNEGIYDKLARIRMTIEQAVITVDWRFDATGPGKGWIDTEANRANIYQELCNACTVGHGHSVMENEDLRMEN
jgi:hypothetical protein